MTAHLEELKAADATSDADWEAASDAYDVALADADESGLDNQTALNAAFDAFDACLAKRYKEETK